VRSKKALITGSCGLIGSEVAVYLAQEGLSVSGIDNNQRAVFFGHEGDTRWTLQSLRTVVPGYKHFDLDIRDRASILRTIQDLRPDLIIHTAAQPSHDKAAAIPFEDFDTNAVGTLNLLEAARRFCPEAPFVHMSTNKVYGDLPNTIAMRESETRWDYADPNFEFGIAETFSIDQSKHSLFGASKVAADIMVQEYGRYFDMPTCCLRGGCLTGPNHSGVELHGFLSYLIRCNVEQREYKVFGYKGKQVRDNIHSEDVARFILAFCEQPRVGEVYNIGGGKENSCSIWEAFNMIEQITGQKQRYIYVDQNRSGDHICYYSDLRKMKAHYPSWTITIPLADIFRDIADSWTERLRGSRIRGMMQSADEIADHRSLWICWE
jgi:CDP-paratose 2-epimerase